METLDAWNAEHPDVQVSREAIDRSSSYDYENKITAATTSNSLPDILFVDGPTVSYYAANGIIVPIDGAYTEEDKEDFIALFHPAEHVRRPHVRDWPDGVLGNPLL